MSYRYRLQVEYDGTGFCGWQRQHQLPSIQGELEAACGRFAGQSVVVHGAGRTDAGVHAIGQVAHCDLARPWAERTVRGAINAQLLEGDKGHQIAVIGAQQVSDTFHARFSAVRRVYMYRVTNRAARPVLARHRSWHVARRLDIPAMAAAAAHLRGTHDFTTFRDAACQAKSAVKTIEDIQVRAAGGAGGDIDDDGAVFWITARSFLHRQVRSMVGTLIQVGLGRWSVCAVPEALAARDRRRCGAVAPAHGLFLARVEYQ